MIIFCGPDDDAKSRPIRTRLLMILPASMSLVVLNPNLLCPAKAQSIDLVGVVCVAQPTYITCPSNPTGLHWKTWVPAQGRSKHTKFQQDLRIRHCRLNRPGVLTPVWIDRTV